MGYDKSDLTFVVHYQAPGSVVAYYQQVGRAGRGVDHADVVLLRGVEDRRIQDFFIEQSFPSRERVTAVLGDLHAAGEAGRSTQELLGVSTSAAAGWRRCSRSSTWRGRCVATARGGRWRRTRDGAMTGSATPMSPPCAGRSSARWSASAPTAAASCACCRRSSMIQSPGIAAAVRCARRRGSARRRTPNWSSWRAGTCARARSSSRSRRWRPTPSGSMRKIPDDVRVEPGWALARFGDGGWWPAVERGLRSGDVRERCGRRAGRRRARGAAGAVAWVTSCRRRGSARCWRGSPRGWPPARRAGAVAGRARRGRARRSERWPTPCSRPPTSAGVSRASARRRRGRACCWMTGAARAGRWPWWADSCARRVQIG